MKTLIVENDFVTRWLLHAILNPYGPSHIAVSGKEVVEAVRTALETKEPYDLMCLDIKMSEMDWQTTLGHISDLTEARRILSTSGAKVFMTTTLNDMKNVGSGFLGMCDAYLVKPIDRAKMLDELHKLKLIK